MLRHFLNPPNWFTSASIFCSTYAVTLLVGHEPLAPETLSKAAMLVVFGGVFDLLDGRIARMTNRSSAFGVQLDSLADTISFGFAPAMLAWGWKLHELGTAGALVAFWYVLCAAFRLARFNVHAEDPSAEGHDWRFGGHSEGLTSTMAGGSLVTLVWVGNGYLADRLSNTSPIALAVLVGLLGFLMVSSVPFRSFKDVRRNARARTMLAVSLTACLVGALFFDGSMWFGVGAFLSLPWGLVDGLIVMFLGRAAADQLVADDDELEADLPALATDEVRHPRR